MKVEYRKIMCAVSFTANIVFCAYALYLLARCFIMQRHDSPDKGITQGTVYSTPRLTLTSSDNGDFVCYLRGKERPILLSKFKDGDMSISVGNYDYLIMHLCDDNGSVTNLIYKDKLASKFSRYNFVNR